MADYPDELRLTGTAVPASITTQDDNGVDVTWVRFRVVSDADVCLIDPDTGVVTLGSAAASNSTCQVYATATATTAANYDEKSINWPTIPSRPRGRSKH